MHGLLLGNGPQGAATATAEATTATAAAEAAHNSRAREEALCNWQLEGATCFSLRCQTGQVASMSVSPSSAPGARPRGIGGSACKLRHSGFRLASKARRKAGRPPSHAASLHWWHRLPSVAPSPAVHGKGWTALGRVLHPPHGPNPHLWKECHSRRRGLPPNRTSHVTLLSTQARAVASKVQNGLPPLPPHKNRLPQTPALTWWTHLLSPRALPSPLLPDMHGTGSIPGHVCNHQELLPDWTSASVELWLTAPKLPE